MAYRKTPMGELVRTDPRAAAMMIGDLIVESRGNIAIAAMTIGVDYRTIARWIACLNRAGHSIRQRIQQAKARAKASGTSWYRPAKPDDRRRKLPTA